MKQDQYKELLNKCKDEINHLKKIVNQISWIRLIIFLLIIVFFIGGYQYKNNLGYLSGFLMLLIFGVLVIKHEKTLKQYNYKKALQIVLEKYLSRFNEEWKEFDEDGSSYLDSEMPRLKDLDIFSKNSLYQYLCNAETIYGKRILANRLKRIPPQKEIIEKEQEAVKELYLEQDFLIKLQCLGIIHDNSNHKSIESFVEIAETKKEKENIFFTIIKWLLPLLSITDFFLIILNINLKYTLILFFLLAGLQMLFAAIFSGRNNKIIKPMFSFNKSLEAYKEIFSLIEKTDFKSEYLKQLQAELKQNNGAVKAIKDLKKIGDSAKIRNNGLAYLLFGSTLMWDFHVVSRFDYWSNIYGVNLKKWLEIVGEIEALGSLTTICRTKEDYTFPTITENNSPIINCNKIKHPLINEKKVVENDFNIQAKTCIITGSNMSGKTTFLRTLGINLVLAYAGGPVLAKKLEVSRMNILTSMRIEDSVSEGVSTFYRELLRIKGMVEYNQPLPAMYLIDEIFKGTNSKDRIIGSIETIKRLSSSKSMTLITTHDFELCDLEKDQEIKAINYHFEEHYKNNEILFDYKIKDGRCKTTNAKHLLKMVGIIK